MDVGKMDKVVLFRINNSTQLGAGGQDGYADLLTTRGYFKQDSGSRDGAFADIQSGSSGSLTVRRQSLLTSNLSTSLQIVFDGRTFIVHSWEDVSEEHFYYKFRITDQRG